jgi:hypothetical protein
MHRRRERDGTKGPGAGSTIHLENEAMRAKVAPRMGFEKHRLIEFESLRRNHRSVSDTRPV